MELFLNTSHPLMILIAVAVIALVIFISRKTEVAWPIIVLMVAITGYLVYHSIRLDQLEKGSKLISEVYHCIAWDLIYMLISFIAYLWVDDIIAKKKNLKSYDDSLSWFWNKM